MASGGSLKDRGGKDLGGLLDGILVVFKFDITQGEVLVEVDALWVLLVGEEAEPFLAAWYCTCRWGGRGREGACLSKSYAWCLLARYWPGQESCLGGSRLTWMLFRKAYSWLYWPMKSLNVQTCLGQCEC